MYMRVCEWERIRPKYKRVAPLWWGWGWNYGTVVSGRNFTSTTISIPVSPPLYYLLSLNKRKFRALSRTLQVEMQARLCFNTTAQDNLYLTHIEAFSLLQHASIETTQNGKKRARTTSGTTSLFNASRTPPLPHINTRPTRTAVHHYMSP